MCSIQVATSSYAASAIFKFLAYAAAAALSQICSPHRQVGVVGGMQDALDAIRAKSATLPPLQSVLELTSAAQMPQRGELTEEALPSAAGGALLLLHLSHTPDAGWLEVECATLAHS